MSNRGFFRFLTSAGAAVLAAVAVSLTPLNTASATEHVPLTSIPEVQYDATVRVPAVESQAGIATALSTDPATMITLPGVPEGHASALVRVSVFEASAPTTVLAAGTPAMTVPAGTASTTVLLPVIDGAVGISGTATADLRVELLASFAGDSPGSTIALPEPVTRADTAEGLADESVDTGVTSVGVVGLGGVPSTGVRAVYLSATVDVPAATVLSISDQTVPVSAGTSTVTTIVTPGIDGTVPMHIAGGSGSLRVDVRGWVPEAPRQSEQNNVTGAYVPVTAAPAELAVTSSEPAALSEIIPGDAQFSLALVSATPAAAPTVLTVGDPIEGRSSGAAIDPTLGALPQLALIPSDEPAAQVRLGETTATVQPVGAILAEHAASGTTPTVTIDGPTAGSTIDLGDEGVLQLHGTVDADISVESVHVTVDGTIIGAAELRYVEGETRWQLDTGVPATGDYEFVVKVTDRSGASSTESVNVTVTLPAATETVIAEDAVILPDDVLVEVVQDDSILFATEPTFIPGEFIVSDVSENAPEGFLREVVAVDATEDGWLVTTAPAALTDVIMQADVDDDVDLLAAGEPTIEEFTEPAEGDTADLEVADGDEPAITILEGDAVDVVPYAHDGAVTEGQPISYSSESSPALPTSFGIDTTLKKSVQLPLAIVANRGLTLTHDVTRSPSQKTAKESEISISGGASLVGSVQVSVSVQFALKISVNWNWGIPNIEVDDFRVVATSTAKAQATAIVYTEVDGKIEISREIEKTVAKIELPTFTFAVGAVPVVITSEVLAKVEASVAFSIEAEMKLQVTGNTWATRTNQYGFSYSTHGGVRTINTQNSTYQPPAFTRTDDYSLTAALDASFGPKLQLNFGIYDSLGPEFTIGFKAGADVEIGAEVGTDTEGTNLEVPVAAALYIEAKVEGVIKLKVPIIDKVLIEVNLFEDKNRYEIASWKWDLGTAFPVKDGAGEPGGGEPSPGDGDDGESGGASGLAMIATARGFNNSALAVSADGQVYSWGTDTGFVSGLSNVVGVAASDRNSLAVTSDGHVYSWSSYSAPTPALVSELSNIVGVAAGDYHSLAVTGDGQVFAWGTNRHGQLGDGTNQDRSVPTLVSGLSNVVSVTAGHEHSFAVTEDGQIFAWGANYYGQLGDGTNQDRSVPTLVSGLSDVVSVAAGSGHSVAVTGDGQVYAWGDNWSRTLGVGHGQPRYVQVPTLVPGLSNVVGVAAGYLHSLAVTGDGQVYTWGHNEEGQLGDGTTQNRFAPTLVSGLSNVAGVSAGVSRSIAVTDDGQIYVWGDKFVYFVSGPGSEEEDQFVPGPISYQTDNLEVSHNGHNFFQIAPVPLTNQAGAREEELLTV